ncbi:hypothetical protein J6590_076189, partial [Homalodisca vitripennis]
LIWDVLEAGISHIPRKTRGQRLMEADNCQRLRGPRGRQRPDPCRRLDISVPQSYLM